MSAPKWTPGPWFCGFAYRTVYQTQDDGFERMIAALGYSDEPESAANARLIASAPDLFEALRVCQVRVFMHEGSENEAYRAAETALTRARGEGV